MWDGGPNDDLTCAYEIAVLSVKLVDGLVPVKVGSGKRMPQLAVFLRRLARGICEAGGRSPGR